MVGYRLNDVVKKPDFSTDLLGYLSIATILLGIGLLSYYLNQINFNKDLNHKSLDVIEQKNENNNLEDKLK